jgi:uncharacterized repeat protein (TIGR01451 family)
VLPAERLHQGRQSIGLSVEVKGPPVVNVNKEATLSIVVKNTATTEALGVVVRDRLPEGLQFLSAQPEAVRGEGSLLVWHVNTLPAAAEKVITLRVKPTKLAPFEHAATVTVQGGSRSRTIVRQPKLKVELTGTPSNKVLRGRQVRFQVAVSNPGDGPARSVTVLARLSPGLRHESGDPNDQNLFEQTLDRIDPGQRIMLDPLVADTRDGGEQWCQVTVQSPDVVPTDGEAHSEKLTVQVSEPKLKLTVSGPEKRYTDTIAPYTITVENPGSATARNVRVAATIPVSGRLVAAPKDALFDKAGRYLKWTFPQLDPGEKITRSFEVRMGGLGLYQISAEARGDGGLHGQDIRDTHVEGIAFVDFSVSERRRVVDENGETTFQIRIKNSGSKEATRLLMTAQLSDNLLAKATAGLDKEAEVNHKEHKVAFPLIESLPAGKELVVALKVQAVKAGLAKCQVTLMHDDLPEKEQLTDEAYFKVTPLGLP